jgi:hypothetical protein
MCVRDIVNRIRRNRECLAPSIMDEAADEIERLERANIKLTAERDEARRSLCRVESACRTVTVEEWCRKDLDGLTKWIPVEPERVAAERGWSCFKEDGK